MGEGDLEQRVRDAIERRKQNPRLLVGVEVVGAEIERGDVGEVAVRFTKDLTHRALHRGGGRRSTNLDLVPILVFDSGMLFNPVDETCGSGFEHEVNVGITLGRNMPDLQVFNIQGGRKNLREKKGQERAQVFGDLRDRGVEVNR